MTVKTNAQGAKRKELVNDIAEWLAVTPTYCGAPTFAYKAGGITIDKNGAIDLPTDLVPGCKGTVTGVDDAGSIHVRWDIGSSLAVVYGEGACKKLDAI